MMFSTVMTVCVGNVCRSPVAEAVLKKLCPQLTVASAGFAAPMGRRASSKMVELAAKDGLNLTNHKARRLSQATPDQFDLILVMEDAHLKEMARQMPHLRARTMLLTQWSGAEDIADPINEDAEFNATVYRQIMEAATAWSSKLGAGHG